MSTLLRRRFFSRSVHAVAPELIGATLLFDGAGGVIVEVEAYHHTDPPAHSFRGRTARNAVMFGPAGYAYVYRSYGMHWCLNFVCERQGSASAVLIRALEPVQGLGTMRRRRKVTDERLLCSGPDDRVRRPASPARIMALRSTDRPSSCARAEGRDRNRIGPRIGITKAADVPWRYGRRGSVFLSKPFR
jgi:DNA-3-methyladenine glycosylase